MLGTLLECGDVYVWDNTTQNFMVKYMYIFYVGQIDGILYDFNSTLYPSAIEFLTRMWHSIFLIACLAVNCVLPLA